MIAGIIILFCLAPIIIILIRSFDTVEDTDYENNNIYSKYHKRRHSKYWIFLKYCVIRIIAVIISVCIIAAIFFPFYLLTRTRFNEYNKTYDTLFNR